MSGLWSLWRFEHSRIFQHTVGQAEVFATLAPYSRILFAFSAGLVEELFARSMVASGLLPMWGGSRKGIYAAAFVSSALFVRTKSVWPGVVMHAVVDLCARLDIYSGTAALVPPSAEVFSRTPTEFLMSMVITVPSAREFWFLSRRGCSR